MTDIETRAFASIRITRNDDRQNRNTRGLYPTGEDAGYTNRVSAAYIDGTKAAETMAQLRAGNRVRRNREAPRQDLGSTR